MRPPGLGILLACAAIAPAAGCTGYSKWLREVVAARPHLDGRLEAPHRVAVLDSGRDAFAFRVERIRAARRSVRIQTFILDDGATTRLLVHELVLAARRGVSVQILTDSMFSSRDTQAAARLATAHPAIEVRVYNPSSDALSADRIVAVGVAVVDFGRLNQRMHNKLMVVDGEVAICGGRNYQDTYFDEDLRLVYRDRDVAVTGPVVAEMEASFTGYWSHPSSVPVDRLRDVAAALAALPAAERGWPFSPAELGFEALAGRVDRAIGAGAAAPRWHEVGAVAFWADTAGKPSIDDDPASVARRLIGAVGGAHGEVLIQSPYLVLSDAAIVLLKQVRARGVPITVHTNSLSSTDNWSSYAHAMRQRREALEYLDLDVFEQMSRPADIARVVPDYADLRRRAADAGGPAPFLSLHAKTVVVDGELVAIGSYNLDPRSEALNSEVLLAVWDPAFAREVADAILLDAAPANSWVLAARRHSMPRALLTDLFGRVNSLVKGVTTLDVWPIEWTSLFELQAGAAAVSRRDDAFYDRYREVGSFPDVDGTMSTILVKLTKALTGFARPLM